MPGEQLSFLDEPDDGDRVSGDGPPRVVHCKTAPAGSFVYIGRPSRWGNPFALADAGDEAGRRDVIDRYQRWFDDRVARDGRFRAALETLRGQDLGCWCKTERHPDRACHGDVILAWLERHPEP